MSSRWTPAFEDMQRPARAAENFAGNYSPDPPHPAPPGLRWERTISGWHLEVEDVPPSTWLPPNAPDGRAPAPDYCGALMGVDSWEPHSDPIDTPTYHVGPSAIPEVVQLLARDEDEALCSVLAICEHDDCFEPVAEVVGDDLLCTAHAREAGGEP